MYSADADACNVARVSCNITGNTLLILQETRATLHASASASASAEYCDNYRVSGALEKLEHETILQDRASDR